jgi:hypothetical protein
MEKSDAVRSARNGIELAALSLNQQPLSRRSASNRTRESCDMKIRKIMLLVMILAALPALVKAQSPSEAKDSSVAVVAAAPTQNDSTYTRPSEQVMLHNYIFDAFGPYPIFVAAAAAGINQATDAPPEWSQGIDGYGRRFGSDFGIALTATTTRYALAEALGEDTLYYRCACSGLFPRVRHAIFSSFTGRRGDDGHRVFSIPTLISPYAGTMTAVYGWYPNRFGAKDAFRMGNYSLLAYMGSNIGLEFFYNGPHSLLSRIHLNNPNAAPAQGPNK